MAIPAILIICQDDGRRSAERHLVERTATLRAPERPIDVLLRDISSSGCFIVTDADMAIGDVVQLGLPGTGRVEARIARRSADGYGCEFVKRQDWAVIEAGLGRDAITPIDGAFRNGSPAMYSQPYINPPMPQIQRWPRPVRIFLMLGLGGLSWLAVALVLVWLF